MQLERTILNPLLLIFIYLSGRFVFYRIEHVLNPRANPPKHIIDRLLFSLLVILLIPDIYAAILVLIIHLFLVFMDTYLLPPRPTYLKLSYLMHLMMALLVAPLLLSFLIGYFSRWSNPIQAWFFNTLSASVLLGPLLAPEQISRTILILCGYLFTLKEGTIFIRLSLNRIRAVPKKKDKPQQRDLAEYERGKLIGILERTFIYFLIIFHQIGAIAVIIALKSLARFKELEDKQFAEYFLIGSLLSLLMAGIPAVVVRILLHYWLG